MPDISRKARTTTFEKLLGNGREVDEEELDRLVEQARNEHHRRVTRNQKRRRAKTAAKRRKKVAGGASPR